MYLRMRSPALLAALLGSLVASGALAQTDTRAAKEKELAAARAQLDDAAKRVASLSRELGVPNAGIYVFEEQALRKPVLGVVLEGDPSRGVAVSGVTPGSGAAKAGLQPGDRIVSVDGAPVAGADADARLRALRTALAGLKAGTAVRIGYERDGKASTVQVVPADAPPVTWFPGDGSEMRATGDVRFLRGGDGAPVIEAQAFHVRPAPGRTTIIERRNENGRVVEHRTVLNARDGAKAGEDVVAAAGVAPEVRQEIIRLAREPECRDGAECRAFTLAEAFRWNGLNLASIDAQLGRYFGTDEGVLVVSAGPELDGVQSGDVIRRVDGAAVKTPREVMDVLRAKPEGATVRVEYLRDRKPGTAELKVPKAMRIPLPAPKDGMAPPPHGLSRLPLDPRGLARLEAMRAGPLRLPPPRPRID